MRYLAVLLLALLGLVELVLRGVIAVLLILTVIGGVLTLDDPSSLRGLLSPSCLGLAATLADEPAGERARVRGRLGTR